MMGLKPVLDNAVKPFSNSKENCCIAQDEIPYKEMIMASLIPIIKLYFYSLKVKGHYCAIR